MIQPIGPDTAVHELKNGMFWKVVIPGPFGNDVIGFIRRDISTGEWYFRTAEDGKGIWLSRQQMINVADFMSRLSPPVRVENEPRA